MIERIRSEPALFYTLIGGVVAAVLALLTALGLDTAGWEAAIMSAVALVLFVGTGAIVRHKVTPVLSIENEGEGEGEGVE